MPISATNNNATQSITVWQESKEGISEQAIVVERVYDGVNLSQGGKDIYIDETSVDELCRLIKQVNKIKLK